LFLLECKEREMLRFSDAISIELSHITFEL